MQPVGSPMRLLPRVVTGPVQSPPSPNRPLVCPVTIVFWSRRRRITDEKAAPDMPPAVIRHGAVDEEEGPARNDAIAVIRRPELPEFAVIVVLVISIMSPFRIPPPNWFSARFSDMALSAVMSTVPRKVKMSPLSHLIHCALWRLR